MASIIKIGFGWRAQIRRKGHKSITRTFPTKAEAEAWGRKIEASIDTGLPAVEPAVVTVGELIAEYRKQREEAGREILDTSNTHYTLNRLDGGLGHIRAEALSTADLVEWCKVRRREGAGPLTVNMDVGQLSTVLRHAGSLMGLRLPDVVGWARPTLHHLGLIGAGKHRERRPTADELERIFAYCNGHPARSAVWPVMEDVVRVALTVGLRRGEIFRIRWADLNVGRRLVLVRDRKDPRRKVGNDQWIPLIGEAFDVVMRQPRSGERIFPFHPQTVSKYFKGACDALGIPDLHFHDMRHEAASVLEELGWPDRMLRLVTGHKDRRNADRYVNLDPGSVFGLPQPVERKKAE